MSNDGKWLNIFIGLATVGSAAVGAVGLLIGILGLFSGEATAAGISLIAAGLAFGLLANAVLRQ